MTIIRTGSIYIIRNRVNEKVYIGQTTMTVHERFKAHMKPSTAKQRQTYKLYNAVNKYGADKFYVETLEDGIPIEELDKREIEYIAKFDSFENGYNSTPGGDGRIINKINNEDELLELANSGMSADELADRYKVHKATILRTLHKLGFYYHIDPEKVLELAESGKSNSEIANELKCNTNSVSRVLARINQRKHRLPIKKRIDFDYDALFKDYFDQMPIEELCKNYDISKTVFNRIKKERGIPNRPQIYK